MIVGLIAATAAIAAGIFGFTTARRFVRRRLRYVDAAQSPLAPVVAGVGAALIGGLVVSVLPIVSVGTALIFGAAVGAGVARGARDVKQLPGE